MNWLVKNNFIEVKEGPVVTKYKKAIKAGDGSSYEFIGEHDPDSTNTPSGFIRCVN